MLYVALMIAAVAGVIFVHSKLQLSNMQLRMMAEQRGLSRDQAKRVNAVEHNDTDSVTLELDKLGAFADRTQQAGRLASLLTRFKVSGWIAVAALIGALLAGVRE